MSRRIIRYPERQAVYRETSAYDSNGELIYRNESKVIPKNAGGFVLSYTSKMCDFIEECSTGATIRVFVYIAHRQQYGHDGVFGYRTSRANLGKALGLSRKSIYSALEYLKSKMYVNELKVDGCFEYMVDPSFVTVGTDRKTREREWTRRWLVHYKLQQSKKHEEVVP